MNRFFSRLILAAWMVVASGAGMILYVGPKTAVSPASTSAGPGIDALYALLYLYFGLMILISYRDCLPLLLKEKWIFALWLWAVASVAWSEAHGVSLRRCVALLGTTAAALFLASRFEPKQQIRLVAHCIGFTAVISLVAALLFPEYAIQNTGEWTGVFYQKNVLGHAMALGVFSYTFLALGDRRGRLFNLLMAALCGGLIVMAQSMSAMLVCTTMFVLLRFRNVLLLRARHVVAFATAAFVLGVPITIYVIHHMGQILKALGRDPTLTGRTALWDSVLTEIATRPWLGFGYSAFWVTSEGDRVQAQLGFTTNHSHNGYLEVTLGLGLIGAAILFIVLMTNILRGIRQVQHSESIFDFWPLFYLLYAVMDNFTESWLVMTNSLLWMLFVANAYWIVRDSLVPVTDQDEDDDSDLVPDFAPGTTIATDPIS